MKFKIFLFCFSFFSILTYSEEIKYKGDNIKVFLDEEGEIEKIEMEGNVVIIYKDITIKANKAVFNRKDNFIECENNVEVLYGSDRFYAEKAIYNLQEEKGIIYKAKFKFDSFYGESEKIERDGDLFKLAKSYITTCELEKPHYRFQTGKIEYWKKKEYLRLEKVKIVFGENFNVFYLPVFSLDLEMKKPFFIPSFEYKTRTGGSLIFSFSHKLSENKNYIMSERMLIGEKGIGAGFEIISDKKNIDFDSFLLKKYDEGFLTGFYFEMKRNFKNSDLLIDWKWMDNNEFFIDFFRDKYLQKSKMFNYFSFIEYLDKGILGLTIRENANEDTLKIEKIPEIRYFLPYINLLDTPFFLTYDFRFTNFYKESENYLRILNKIDLIYKKDFPYFTIKPYISFSSLNYPDFNLYKFNFIGEEGINFSTNLYSKFQNVIFTPSISFFNRQTKHNPENLIQFDEFEEKKSGNFFTSSLFWNINSFNGINGNLKIENEYNFDNRRFENIFLKYELYFKNFKIEGENEWKLENNESVYEFGFNTISYEKEKYKFSVGTRMDRESDIYGLETWYQQSLKNDWNCRIGVFYDFNSGNLLTQTYEIWKKIHCLVIDFRFTRDVENKSFYIFIVPSVFFENNWQRRFEKWK
jgi:lipopolysaccharide assembly outer membrane protein LptD (OstA)